MLDASSLLDWAQTAYGTLFNGATSDGYADVPGLGSFYYRHWQGSGNFVGVLDGNVYLYGPASGFSVQEIGPMQNFLCVVRACASSTPLQAQLAGMRMANWYPAANSWTNMWINFDPALIQREFAALANAGFNAVRIFPSTPAPAFSVPSPPAGMLAELAQVIDLADKAGLKVQLTLFDIWSGFSDPNALAYCRTWVDAVVAPYAGDPRIAYIDVKNEIDLTDPAQMAWLQSILPYVKSRAGGIPVTASIAAGHSVSEITAAMAAMRTQQIPVDLYDVHYYFNAALAAAHLRAIRAAAQGMPVFFGESGVPTATDYDFDGQFGVPRNAAAREAFQEKYYRTLTQAFRDEGMPTPSPWTFNDFVLAGVPSYMQSYNQSQNTGSSQYMFGLRRTDGSAKPALATVTQLNHGGSVSLDINNGFESVDTDGLPLEWRLWSVPSLGFTATFSVDATVAHTGAASARIDNATSSPSGTPAFFTTPVSQVRTGVPITFQAWAKGRNVTGAARVSLAWMDASYQWLSTAYSNPLPKGTTDWTLLSVTAEPPVGAAAVQLQLESDANPAGTVWFDDVLVQ